MKRKILSMFLATVMMFGTFDVTYGATTENTVTAQSTSATIVDSGKCGDNVTYTLDSNGLLTISGSGDMFKSGIGDSPFRYNSDIKKVVIDEGVTNIGYEAFRACSNLASIKVSNSVTSIGDYAFCECSRLTSIEISNSVTSIGDYVFADCYSLDNIYVSESNSKYKSQGGVLYDKKMTKLIVCPAGKKENIEIPVGVTSIGDYAFGECSHLTSIEIPNSVTSIGHSVFYNCGSLTSIEIPAGVTSIGGGAFFCCSSLTSIEIPAGVTSIGNSAFEGCSSLTSIEIPASVISIGGSAFDYCSNLNTIYCYKNSTADKYTSYPSTATKVYLDDVTTTESTTESTSVTETTTETTTTVENLFNFNSSTGTITGYSGSEKVVNIPSNIGGVEVKVIGENAFKNNTDIETVIIPEGISSIEDFAFYKCTGLKYVSIPESVTSVSEDGFYRCGALNVTCKKGSTADNISLYPSGSTIVYYVEKGDINGDGSIDMRDVIILMKYVTGKVSKI